MRIGGLQDLKKYVGPLLAVTLAGAFQGFFVSQWLYVRFLCCCAICWAIFSIAFTLVRHKPKSRLIAPILLMAVALFGLIMSPKGLKGPSTFRTQIGPMNYENAPLAQVLQDFARQADSQRSYARFDINDKKMAEAKVTLRTESALPFKQALTLVLEPIGCEFWYGLCGTCGGIIGPIQIYKKGQEPFRGAIGDHVYVDKTRIDGLSVGDKKTAVSE